MSASASDAPVTGPVHQLTCPPARTLPPSLNNLHGAGFAYASASVQGASAPGGGGMLASGPTNFVGTLRRPSRAARNRFPPHGRRGRRRRSDGGGGGISRRRRRRRAPRFAVARAGRSRRGGARSGSAARAACRGINKGQGRAPGTRRGLRRPESRDPALALPSPAKPHLREIPAGRNK